MKNWISLSIILGCLVGSATADTSRLGELLDARKGDGAVADSEKALRMEGMRALARRMGVTAGFNDRAEAIRAELLGKGPELDGVYTFSMWSEDGGRMLPPVVVEADRVRIQGADEVREVGKLYRIEKPARIVSAPPTWRDYLLLPNLSEPRAQSAYFPSGGEEVEVWEVVVTRSYEVGVAQAEAVFKQRLAELERDLSGMILGQELVMQGIMSESRLSEIDRGTLIEGNTLSVDDKVYVMDEQSEWQAPEKWTPVVVAPGDAP